VRRLVLVFLVASLLAGEASEARPLPDRSGEPERQLRLGVSLQQEGRMAEAIEAFRTCLRLDPMRAEAYARLREAYGHGRTVDQLVAELRQRVDQDDTDFVSWNLLGVLNAKLGRWSDAVAALERAVGLQSNDIDAWTNLGWLSSELKQVNKAREAFGRALALDPGSGRAHAGMAGLYAEEGGDYDKAIEEYRLALAAEPDNPAYLYDLGWAYYRKGKTDGALEILTRALALRPDDAAGRTKIGWARLRRKEYRTAIEEFQQALRLERTYAFARFGLARALQAEGHLDAAMVEYKQAWRESKNDLYLIYVLGLYLQRSFWIILLAVVLGMMLALVWLLRRRAIPQSPGLGRESKSRKA
jgi:tetratricopeptide (TPR) repeat protein